MQGNPVTDERVMRGHNPLSAAAVSERGDPAVAGTSENPWLNDETILSLSVWWVRMTTDSVTDFSAEVTQVFNSLERDLRRDAVRPFRFP